MTNFLKYRMIAATCFLAAFLASCSQDKIGGGNEAEGAGENGYISLAIRGVAGLGTRAMNIEDGQPSESKVSGVLVVLYDAAEGKVAKNLPFAITSDGNSAVGGEGLANQGTVKRFQTIATEVERKNYKLLVVVNPSEAVKAATAEGKTISDFTKAVVVDDITDLTGASKDNFLMTNWQGLVQVNADQVHPSKERAEDRPIEVNVERAVAKVSVAQPAVGADYFNVEGWTLDVINTKTYWMREPWMAVNQNGSGETTPAESADVMDRYLNYAKDPNAAKDQLSPAAWHSYQAWLATDGSISTKPAYRNDDFRFVDIEQPDFKWNGFGDNVYEYVVENTMEAQQQYRDVTTAVIMKITYNPAVSALGATVGESDPYYVYYIADKRYVFTPTELQQAYDQNHLPAPVVDSQDRDIAEFFANIDDYYALLGGNDFAAYAAANNDNSQLRYDFGYFGPDHVNYYRAPIRHYADSEQPTIMGYGRFGLVRNNVYKLTVNDVTGPGAAEIVPPTPDVPVTPAGPEEPVGPDEEEYGWISTDIQVLEWVVRTQDVVVGD